MKIKHLINNELKNEYKNVKNKYQKKDNKYQFVLDNISNNIYITDRLVFERENDEYKIHIEIGKTNKCNIYLKDKEISFEINVIDASYRVDNKVLEYEYILETDNDKHKIIIENED